MKFSLKKNRDAENVNEQQDEIVRDFTRKTPFWSYSPVSYQLFGPFANLIGILDSMLQKFFEGEGGIDEGNGNVLDAFIVDTAREALEDLNRQRISHVRAVKDLHLSLLSNQRGFQDELAFYEVQLSEVEEELAEIKNRMKN